jgi:hypothetical protein
VVAREAIPLCIVLLLLTIELRHIAHSSWLSVFLYNGDSLTLPVLREALARHEPFVPILSTQLLIFPEGMIYALCSAITTSIRASLVLNAYVNIVLLYAAARGLATVVVPQAARRRTAAAAFCVILMGLMLLESGTDSPNQQFVTLCLLTTFYYGVILCGMVVLVATVRQVGHGSSPTSGRSGWTYLAIGISTLAYFSNPLFLLQVTAPLILTVLLLALLRRIHPRQAGVVIGCQAVSLAAGTALREPFKGYIGASATSYLKFGELSAALGIFRQMMKEAWSLPSDRIEVIVVGAILIVGALQFVDLLREQKFSDRDQPGNALLVVTFSIIAPVIDLLGVLASGNSTSRYFVPVFVFSLLSLIPLAAQGPGLSSWRRVRTSTSVVATATALLVAGVVTPGLEPLLSASYFPDAHCLEQALGGEPRTGIAQYWTARALDVYSTGGVRVLQVLPSLQIFAWLVNLGEFEHRHPSFVLVDRRDWGRITLTANDTLVLGKPVAITTCPSFFVYSYPQGTKGFRVMNSMVSSSLAGLLKARG